jgi:hypothetical protein
MVVLSIRNRQNRECVDEDLRANKKVFERLQQQISIFPQTEMPASDKLQAIAYQFNKDIENVKNALNDGLTDMNTPDAAVRGFADFSKVSLAWNKLVARINPYLKGQQTAATLEAATANDYSYVRQKLKDDLFQFFNNAIQQINSWAQGVAAAGGVPRVQNEASVIDIRNQLSTGFYKNVRYGAEQRTSLMIPILPPDVQRGGPPGAPGGPGLPPGPPGAPGAPQRRPQVPSPAQQPPGQPLPPPASPPGSPPASPPGLRPVSPPGAPQGHRLDREIINLFEQWEQVNGEDIDGDNADLAAAALEEMLFNAAGTAQPPTQQQRDDMVERIGNEIIPVYIQYRDAQRAAAESPARRRRPQPLDPASVAASQQPTRASTIAQHQAIFDKANEIGVYNVLSGYSRMNDRERRAVSAEVKQLADALRMDAQNLRRYLRGMRGFGRSSGSGQRGRPLRIANDFTGTSVVPNTLANLKNRYKGESYIGTMDGLIDPTLQNRGVLGSARRMEGAAVAEVLASIKQMSRAALENILFPAFNALGVALRSGARVGAQVPQAVRAILETSRGVYRREDVQTVLSYLREHPDVLIPFLPTPFAIGAVAGRLIQHYMNLPAQTGREARQGREMAMREEEDYVVGDGSGRCCFNSSMCNGTKAYRFKRGEKSANVRKASVKGRGRDAEEEKGDEPTMEGGGSGVNVNVKYSKLPKALQPTEEDLNPSKKPRSAGGVRRRRMPKESYEGYQDQENDVYTQRGGVRDTMPLLHTEMLQDKTLGLLKGLPRRLGVEDPKYKQPKK